MPRPPMAPEGLFVTDAELARRCGVSEDRMRAAIRELERKGFPRRDPLFGNKRFWPAVEAFFLQRAGVSTMPASQPDGEEHWP